MVTISLVVFCVVASADAVLGTDLVVSADERSQNVWYGIRLLGLPNQAGDSKLIGTSLKVNYYVTNYPPQALQQFQIISKAILCLKC